MLISCGGYWLRSIGRDALDDIDEEENGKRRSLRAAHQLVGRSAVVWIVACVFRIGLVVVVACEGFRMIQSSSDFGGVGRVRRGRLSRRSQRLSRSCRASRCLLRICFSPLTNTRR